MPALFTSVGRACGGGGGGGARHCGGGGARRCGGALRGGARLALRGGGGGNGLGALYGFNGCSRGGGHVVVVNLMMMGHSGGGAHFGSCGNAKSVTTQRNLLKIATKGRLAVTSATTSAVCVVDDEE